MPKGQLPLNALQVYHTIQIQKGIDFVPHLCLLHILVKSAALNLFISWYHPSCSLLHAYN